MSLPTLYNVDKKGAIRVWDIKVVGSTIHVEHGLQSGQKVNTTETITKGKNIGKKNETTPAQQANLEAKSKWTKKKDKGYSTSVSVNKEKVNFNPMLAHEFKKHKNKVKFPVYVQPKLDGYRMVYDGVSDKILSRTGKEYTILINTPLHSELKKIAGNSILDGELYVHDQTFAFEAYGILRKKKLSTGDAKILDQIIYNVYDTMAPGPYVERYATLRRIVKNTKHISLVKTEICPDMTCVDKLHNLFLQDNYEGSMVRSSDGIYINNRSTALLKYKNFDDAEFKVIGFEKESDTKGDGATPVVWVAQTTAGKTFRVPSKGTRIERTKLYVNGSKYIGKNLSVQFFGLTADGIPRFPKTLRDGASSFRLDL